MLCSVLDFLTQLLLLRWALDQNSVEGHVCEVMADGVPNVQLSVHQQ
jgi:hypothetical protein